MVLLIAGAILAILGLVLSVGLVVVKILLFVVLPILAVWWLFRWLFETGPRRGGEAA